MQHSLLATLTLYIHRNAGRVKRGDRNIWLPSIQTSVRGYNENILRYKCVEKVFSCSEEMENLILERKMRLPNKVRAGSSVVINRSV